MQIIESRNAMMHSPLNNVNDADLKKYIDAMVDFLKDALKSQIKDNIRQQLNKAQEEIRQVVLILSYKLKLILAVAII
jgi:glycine cleavage system protein P-like pyridoxal-binding family